MDELNKISKSLLDVLTSAELQDVSADIVDALSNDNSVVTGLGGIPIVSNLIGIARAGVSIRDQLFCRKLLAFLKCLAGVSAHDRIVAIRQIEENSDYRTKVGDRLISILDRCDSESKAEIMAWLFSAYINGEGSYDDFLRCAAAVNTLVVDDVIAFVKYQDLAGNLSDILSDIGPIAHTELVYMTQEKINIEKVSSAAEHEIYGDFIVSGGDLNYSISSTGKFLIVALKGKELRE